MEPTAEQRAKDLLDAMDEAAGNHLARVDSRGNRMFMRGYAQIHETKVGGVDTEAIDYLETLGIKVMVSKGEPGTRMICVPGRVFTVAA